jgi:hypothetical protein
VLLGSGLGAASATRASSVETVLRFRLRETAGLRRFGYPVQAILPQVHIGNHFRLSRAGKVVSAQFRAIDGPDGGPAVALDFNASPGPLETENYAITYGADVEHGPEPQPGMRVEKLEGAFRVWNGSLLEYVVPDNLRGFLKYVGNAHLAFLAEQGEGLLIRSKDDMQYKVGSNGPGGTPTRASVAREGPMAVSLRFESSEALGDNRSLKSAATLTFPSSKSWVETTWTVDDPEGLVAGLGVDLALAVEGNPTLVDLGASDTVYGQLRRKDRMELRAGEAPGFPAEPGPWSVLKGTPDQLELLAAPPPAARFPAQGWAHVIDASRCTALALAGFGRKSRDRIEVNASGRVRLWRDFAGKGAAAAPGPKSLTFWFHFVTNPVQVGAATSPQAMLAPLLLEWDPEPA